MTTTTTTTFGHLLSVADDLASAISDRGYGIASVQAMPHFGVSFQLDGDHHPTTLVGLLVDLDCANITDHQYGPNDYLTDATGTLPDGTTVKVYASRSDVTA